MKEYFYIEVWFKGLYSYSGKVYCDRSELVKHFNQNFLYIIEKNNEVKIYGTIKKKILPKKEEVK